MLASLPPVLCFERRTKIDRPAPVSAVMVLHDPLDWALETQVVCDVLRGGVACILHRGFSIKILSNLRFVPVCPSSSLRVLPTMYLVCA